MTVGDDDRQIEAELVRRRAAAVDAWQLDDQVVLVAAGEPILIPGRGDITYPFHAHSEYFYLTDHNRPGGVLAFAPEDGWTHFQPPVTEADRLWSAAPDAEPDGPTTAALEGWLAARSGRPLAMLGTPPAALAWDDALTDRLRSQLSRVRWRKDQVELARMRTAAEATRAAFAAAAGRLRAGVTERDVQVELEAAAIRAGADGPGYDTIVGSGPNSAVLHFMPTRRRLRDGDLVLIDAGAAYREYTSDVTRTYAVVGAFTPQQREIYATVQQAERAALNLCRAGVEWRDVHLAAALVIAEGLVAVGLLRGQPQSLVESGAAGLFFPHGIGHLVGLGVRDAGGVLPERRDQPPPFPNLRIDLPLEPGMVVTVEPGLYFVPALLQDPGRRSTYRQEVAWDQVDGMLAFGGVRIEDNALITAAGPELLTQDIPQPAP